MESFGGCRRSIRGLPWREQRRADGERVSSLVDRTAVGQLQRLLRIADAVVSEKSTWAWRPRPVPNLRSLVEGAFGILKNRSRQRRRRGQNRLPGLAMANLINALKSSVFNGEQVRLWHERTGRGPVRHPCCNQTLTTGASQTSQEQARAIDARYLNANPDNQWMAPAA